MLELEIVINDTEGFIDVSIGSVCFYLNQLMRKYTSRHYLFI